MCANLLMIVVCKNVIIIRPVSIIFEAKKDYSRMLSPLEKEERITKMKGKIIYG